MFNLCFFVSLFLFLPLSLHPFCYLPVYSVVGLCRGSLPSLVRELAREAACEPKLVYEVGFIREKGKATARAVQGSPETSGSLLR
jgi:hypothetical protein